MLYLNSLYKFLYKHLSLVLDLNPILLSNISKLINFLEKKGIHFNKL